MMVEIQCPKCATKGWLSLIQSSYQSPYRCWKCKELFTITVENNELKSCVPLSKDDFEKQRAADDLKSKFRRF
jgi:DNA-directed RNA polymerase subunit RPC12/RpoP